MDGFQQNRATGIPSIGKDASAVLPYTIDWYDWLRGDDLYWGEFPDTQRFYRAQQTITPSRGNLNGHRYRAENAGVPGSGEPVWPTASGATVTDGTITWTEIGAEDTLDSAAHAVADGLTMESEANTDTTTTIELSGGTAGTRYRVTCHVETVHGNEDDRSFDVVVRQR